MARFRSLFLLMVAALLVSAAAAQTTPPEEEDPADNACYAGGEWEYKCDWPTDLEDEWAWTCGWYYARVRDARLPVTDYPERCGILYCIAVNDVFDERDYHKVYLPDDSEYEFISAPGVLANDPNCGQVVSYELIHEDDEPSPFYDFFVFADGSFQFNTRRYGAVLTFRYLTENGSTATVTVYTLDDRN